MDVDAPLPRLNAVQRMLAAPPATRTALVGRGGSLCYGELQQAVARAAWAWQDCGVLPGETVLLRLAPGRERTVAMLGAIWAGAVALQLPREAAAGDWQPWAAGQGCRFVLDESRDGHPTAWRDHVLTRGEWRIALAESLPVPPYVAEPAAPACWTDFRPGGPLRLVAHRFALTASAQPGGVPHNAHTDTALGLLRALRRGATVVLPEAAGRRPAPAAWRRVLRGLAP